MAFDPKDYDKKVDFDAAIKLAKVYPTKSEDCLMGNLNNKVKLKVQKSKFQTNDGQDQWEVSLIPVVWTKKQATVEAPPVDENMPF